MGKEVHLSTPIAGQTYALCKWKKDSLEALSPKGGYYKIVPHVTPLMLVQERIKKFSNGKQLTLDL